MNKLCYRVIYNRTRQLMVVVSELTKSCGENNKRNTLFSSPIKSSLNSMAFILLLMQGMISFSVQASQIIADQHAPNNQQATVLQTSNGIAQINIQQPNQHGVSRNQFTQFDVDNKGAILNNSLQDTQTQLAGMVTGNPWLVKGEANVILNEINSQNPSQLNGFIEVAGKRAEIIIANPAGISCQGCGFINAVNTTLVAGKALTQDGAIAGYEINNGKIVISGRGLNDSQSDYTRILARAVEVNSRIQANKLEITTGKNTLDNNGNVISQDDSVAKQNDYAVDVALIGGMYANKIKLVGTEHGVGVRNAGEIGAEAGGLTLNENGQLINIGLIQSKAQLQINTASLNNQGIIAGDKNLALNTTGDLVNSGILQAKNNIQLKTTENVSQTALGKIVAQNNIQIDAKGYLATDKSQLGAGIDNSGNAVNPASLTLNIADDIISAGQHLSGDKINLTAKNVDISNSKTQSKDLHITASVGQIKTEFVQVNANTVMLNAKTEIINRKGEISADKLQLIAPNLIDNSEGKLSQSGSHDLKLNSVTLNNPKGEINSAGNLALNHQNLNNQHGDIQSLSRQLIIKTTALNNQKGTISLPQQGAITLKTETLLGKEGSLLTTGQFSLQGQYVDLEKATTQAKKIEISAVNLNHNDANLKQTGTELTSINVEKKLSNQRGNIQTQGALTLNAQEIDNTQGEVRTLNQSHLDITAIEAITNNKGALISSDTLKLHANILTNQQGNINADKTIDLTLNNKLDNNAGKIVSKNNSEIKANILNNAKGEIGANGLNITLTGHADNQQGAIISQNRLRLTANNVDNSQGIIQSEKSLWLSTQDGELNNQNTHQSGGIISRGELHLNAGDINNSQGIINAKNSIDLQSKIVNSQQGKIVTQGDFTANTQGWDNTSGLIQAFNITINSNNQPLINRDTQKGQGIQATQNLRLNTGVLDNSQGDISASQLQLNTAKLGFINQFGRLTLSDHATLKTGAINNHTGLIITGKDLIIDSHQQKITNSETQKSGGIVSQGGLNIHSGDLNNQQGQILAKQQVDLQTNIVTNQSGQILSELANLTLKGISLNNSQGHLFSPQPLQLTLRDHLINRQTIDGNKGIETKGTLTINSGDIDSTQGRIVSADQLTVKSGNLVNQQGILGSLNSDLSITSKQLINDDGSISANNIIINTQGERLSNQSTKTNSQIFSRNALNMTTGELNNTKGKLISNASVNILTYGELNNTQGEISGHETLEIETKKAINNTQGSLASNKLMTLTTGSELNNTKGKITSHNALSIETQGKLDNTLGKIIARNSANVLSYGDLINYQGRLGSEKSSLTLNTHQIDNRSGVISAQGDLKLDPNKYAIDNTQTLKSGGIVSQKNITIDSGALNNQDGQLVAKYDAIINTHQQQITNNNGIISADNGTISIDSASIKNISGLIYSLKEMVINTNGQRLDNTQGVLASQTGKLLIASHELLNHAGLITANTALNINTGKQRIDNSDTATSGGIISKGELEINAGNIDNLEGKITSTAKQSLFVEDINNKKGKIGSIEERVLIESGAINNQNGLITAKTQLDITTENNQLDNRNTLSQAGIISHGALNLVTGNLNNQSGYIFSAKSLLLNSLGMSNRSGEVISQANGFKLTTQTLDNQQGTLYSADNFTLDTQGYALNNNQTLSGGIISQGKLDLKSGELNNIQGRVISDDDLNISSAKLINRQAQLGSKQGGLNLKSAELDNKKGVISASQNVVIDTQKQNINNQNGLISALTNLTIYSGQLVNQTGKITTNKQATINATDLDNRKGSIASNRHQLIINANNINNAKGLIYAVKALTINADGKLTNTDNKATAGIITQHNLNATVKQLDNQNGLISVASMLKLISPEKLNNQQGLITVGQKTDLQTEQLNNYQGKISAGDLLTISHSNTPLINRDGALVSAGAISLNSGDIDNQQGKITALNAVTINSGELQNNQGTIYAKKELNIHSQELVNTDGLLQSDSQLKLNTRQNDLINLNGKVIGATETQLNIAGLNNQKGHIQATDKLDLQLNQSELDNQQGTLLSANNLLIDGKSIDNQQGVILAGNNTEITLSQGLNNQIGQIQSQEQLTVTAQQLDNQQTDDENLGLKANNIHIAVNDLLNHQGVIQASEQLKLIPTENLNNQRGLISAAMLAIEGKNENKLAIDNKKGLLAAIQQLRLWAEKLSGNGEIISAGGSEIQLKTAFKLEQDATIKAQHSLTLSSEDEIHNAGFIYAGERLSLQATNLNNSEPVAPLESDDLVTTRSKRSLDDDEKRNGEISAKRLILTISEKLQNTGLIDAFGGTLTLTADAIYNQAGGRIYGDNIQLKSQQFDNHAPFEDIAPVLASRENLQLLSNTINNRNHALIYSGGDMAIAGFETENLSESVAAGVLNNESASIEASGNLFAHISEINNRDLYLKISDPEKVSEVPMYQFGVDHSGDKFDSDDERIWYNINTREHLLNINGRQYKDFYEFKYKVITEESKLLHRDPALILAGKDITLKGDNLNNIDSHIIAGGKLIIDGMHINNQETAGQRIEYHEGTAIKHKRPGKRRGGRKKSSSTSHSQYGPFEVVTDLSLGLLEYKENSDLTSDKRPELSEQSEIKVFTTRRFGRLIAHHNQVDVDTAELTSITPEKTDYDLGDDLSLTKYKEGLLTDQSDLALFDKITTKKLDETINGNQSTKIVLESGDTVSTFNAEQTAITQPNGVLPEIKRSEKHPELPIGKIITVPQLEKPTEEKTIEVKIQTVAPILKLPENRLFNVNKGTDSQYIVETDSRFTNKREWLSSDYMQNALSVDHNNTHKRIGDGFYEQRIIRDQIIQLTGNQYLDGHNDNEQQYHALMDAGIRFSEEFGIKPGVTLTAEQMAMITTDMVLLTSREITLANGFVEKVLVPQVYARVLPGDLQNSGALLSGSEVILNNIPELKNKGTILSKIELQASTDNLINQGLIKGQTVDLLALQDIQNEGGQIAGQNRINLQAGNDIISTATVSGNNTDQWLNRGAAIYLTESDGEITLKATRNLALTATDILASGDNSQLALTAGKNIELGTINTRRQENIDWDSNNYLHKTTEEEIGSHLYAGDISIASGEDLHLTATDIQATGSLGLTAGNDISLQSGYSSIDQIAHSVTKDKSFGSSETRTTHAEIHNKQATGTELKGNEVSISAGNDLIAQGSEIIATQDINLDAGNQLSLTTAEEFAFQSYEEKIKKSGIGGTGGIGFTVGKSAFEQLNNSDAVTQKGSVIGSTDGNIRISSGDNLTIDGSEMIAKKEISLTGDSVDILATENSYTELSKTKTKQSGFTVALSGTAGSAINGAISGYKASKEADDSQISTLQGIKAGLSGAQAAGAVALDNAQSGTDNESTTLIGANVAYGKSSSESERIQQQNIAQGSSLSAGENLSITATGKEQGDITITGSELQAGGDLTLSATRDITLQSAQNQETIDSKNSSKSASVGVGVTVGSGGVGVNINANGSRAKGFEEGDHTYYTNSTLNAGQTLTLQSGQDTTLKGAQAQGDKVIAKVGGDLHLESQQAIDDYKSKQSSESAGGSVNVMGTPGGSANLSFSRDKMDSKYRSVEEQTGLFAGNQGFDISVGKHTQLDGAVISSTAEAKNNQLDTGTLGFSDIHNYAEYKVEHQSGGVSTSGGVEGNMLANMGHALAMAGNHSDSAENTTQSAVSQGTWTVRDSDNQQQDIAQLSQDTDNAHSTLNKIFDKEKEQSRQQKQQLVGEIGAQIIDLATTADTIRGTHQAKEES
ncbi:hemagglutinin repeat-containing protein, partial [Proteus sp. G2666]|uniref:hemagglutinin repeat-containing protein n=1 Tax=Proteus sp. G2666 TaxID=2698879 RepID=UPI0013782AFD